MLLVVLMVLKVSLLLKVLRLFRMLRFFGGTTVCVECCRRHGC